MRKLPNRNADFSLLLKRKKIRYTPRLRRIFTQCWSREMSRVCETVRGGIRCAFVLALVSILPPLHAVSVGELQHTKNLTPKKFANYFERFAFELHEAVQSAPKFLARERGDCDDYAVLADFVLPHHGFETRLVHIRLAGKIDHAVCFVTEEKAYLDYNNRAVFFTMTRSSPDLRTIAEKVADSLDANWTSASEFVFSYETNHKTVTATVVRTADPQTDPPPRKAPVPDSGFQVD